MRISRRTALAVMTAVGIGCVQPAAGWAEADPLKVAMLIPGNIADGGFMQAGYEGLLAIHDELGAETSYIDAVKPEQPLLAAALRELAEGKPDMIIAHGGQNSPAIEEVAPEFPDIRFVVVQGGVTGAERLELRGAAGGVGLARRGRGRADDRD